MSQKCMFFPNNASSIAVGDPPLFFLIKKDWLSAAEGGPPLHTIPEGGRRIREIFSTDSTRRPWSGANGLTRSNEVPSTRTAVIGRTCSNIRRVAEGGQEEEEEDSSPLLCFAAFPPHLPPPPREIMAAGRKSKRTGNPTSARRRKTSLPRSAGSGSTGGGASAEGAIPNRKEEADKSDGPPTTATPSLMTLFVVSRSSSKG